LLGRHSAQSSAVRVVMWIASLVLASALVGACGSSSNRSAPTVPPASSSTTSSTAARPTPTISRAQAAAAQQRADKAKILAMWRAENDAWNTSRTAGINATIADTWPPSRGVSGMNFAQCNRFLNSQLWSNVVIETSTIRPQPGWASPLTHTVPQGRIYRMTGQFSSRLGAAVQPTQSQEIHAVVAPDGHAYNFNACHN